MNRMTRIIVNDRLDQFRFEIDPAQVIDATSIEEVNGEHSVTITTLQELEKTDRLLIKDGMGRWHEYVVLGIEERHTAGGAIQHEYYCVWSLQYDLSATFINDQFGCGVVPGHASIPQTPRRALECALEGTSRWAIGTITVTTQSSASFYRRSGWEGLQTVIERWGGSLRATITVGLGGAVTRAVDLLEHEGDATATRRFDYGFDVTSIKRVVSDEIWPCRIVPLGKSMETEAGGYTRRPSIESVNQGIPWLQDDAAAPLVRIPDGSGGWEYPTAIIKNDTYEEPADLMAWAQAHISDYTRPIVSYEAEVAQFAQAGLDPHGVALGDEVIVVDRTFGEGGLRITARVVRIESSLLDPADVKLTIGNAQSTLAGQLADLAVSVAAVSEQTASSWQWQSSSDYMSALLGRINDEANATGGYTYITEGQGIRTYDVPVSDPLVGAEASSVVEVKGGTIRIANSRDSQGNWEWKTVFTSGHIAADLVTALAVNAGYIGNPSNSSYWDLDAGLLHLGMSYNVTYSSSTESYLLITENGYVGTPTNVKHSAMFGVTFSGSKELYGLRCETGAMGSTTSSWVALVPCNFNGQVTNYDSCLVAKSNLRLFSNLEDTDIGGFLELTDGRAALRYATSDMSTDAANVYVEPGQIEIVPSSYRNTTGFKTTSAADSSGYYNHINGSTYVRSLSAYSLTISGPKSRAADTDGYGTRLLYSVESPTPMFSDIGSGVIGEDGTCYVAIDDVFSETVRADLAYQVFLQKCGEGDLWVAEKHATHFVVQGAAGLAFDWELKARQAGFETTRLDSLEMRTAMDVELSEMAKVPYEVEDAYDDMGVADMLEAIWMQELEDLEEVNA